MFQPKVSIIIPVYNTEKYLRECLDSVLSQTLQDIEIILVNDASPDHSQDIIDEYMAKDARIQCIVHSENLGIGGVRNTGITVAQGEYIAFIDSDDWIDRDCYATVIEKMEKNGANLGVFSIEQFDDQTGIRWFHPYFDFPYSSAQRITAQNINQIPVTMCGKVFRCEDLQQDILRLPIHLKHEDEEFWFKYASWIRPLAIGISEKIYHYRQHSVSTMANRGISRKDYPQILQNIGDYLEKAQLYSECHAAFEEKIIQSLGCYERLSIEYREQYCRDMCQLFKQCHLTMAEVLELESRLGIYYIEDELLRQHFLQIQQNHHYQIEHDRWYRFGQLSRKRKLWVIARGLSKRLKLYNLLRPLAKVLKRIFE